MEYDEADGTTTASSQPERDVLGELIQAAGRRPMPSAEQYDQTFAAAHGAWQQTVRSSRRRQRNYAIAATLAAVAVGLGAAMQMIPDGPVANIATAVVVQGDAAVFSPANGTWQPLVVTDVAISPGSRIRTDVNGRTALTLGEDISVRLNTDSELVFSSASELELIAGTVYIDSGPDQFHENLEITTSHGRIRDIGTQFEIAAISNSLRVRVREGLVQLYQSGQTPELEGVAGEEFRINAVGAIRRDSFSRFDPEWSWAEALAGPPDVNGMAVAEFLNWVARETGRLITYEDDGVQLAAGTAVLHGSAQELTPMDALEAMLATTDFNYALSTDGVIVISRRSFAR